MKRMKLLIGVILIGCASAFGQGFIGLYNHTTDVNTKVYGPNATDPTLYQFGNGPSDVPAGTQDWTGFTGLSGTGYTVQLWYAPGPNQPESSLQPASPTTIFYDVPAAAGVFHAVVVALPGAPAGTLATLAVRVWDNQGGTVTSWAMAQAAGALLGESPEFNSPPLADPVLPVTQLVGLVSFNIHQVPEPDAVALLSFVAFLFWLARSKKGA